MNMLITKTYIIIYCIYVKTNKFTLINKEIIEINYLISTKKIEIK